jgi:two-component system chemotaxis response regulator CheB
MRRPLVGGRVAVTHAVDGASLWLGYAYVAPPGRHLVVDRRAVHLVVGPPVHFAKPCVEGLFESAAEMFGQRLAWVVLSGTGADGATGARAVREQGGVTFAQRPEGAEYPGMPEAASATGAVDRVLSLGDLGAALRRLATDGRAALHNSHG